MRIIIVPWAYALMAEFYFYGLLILVNIGRNWNNPNKIQFRMNEVLYGCLYLLFGYLSLSLFANDGLSYETENKFYMLIFLFLLGLDAFWWLGNFVPNMIECKRHPEIKEQRKFSDFIDMVQTHHKDTVFRDLTRKFLHVILVGIVIGFYLMTKSNASNLDLKYENWWAFCKFLYVIIAFGFCNMFTLADVIRTAKYHWIPGWARKWYATSLNPKEIYTIISSVPYVLSMALLVFGPIQVLFIAAVVSSVGDGCASVFGKAIGKHKFPSFLDKKKSFEGLLAGMIGSLITTIMVLIYFPVQGQTSLMILAIGLSSMMIFAMIDLFARKIADNILNVLLPGISAWLLLAPIL